MAIRVLVRDLQLTIVKKHDVYPGYQLNCLTAEAKEQFSVALRPGKQWLRRHEQISKLFECFLYLCETVVTTQSFRTVVFRELALRFIGAVNSEKFITATRPVRLNLTRAFLVLLGELGIYFPELRWRRKGFGADMIPIVNLFEDMEFDSERVWVLGAWWTTNLKGEGIHLPLFPVYMRFGQAFAETMFKACEAHLQVRAGALPGAFKSLCNLISKHPTLTESDLKDSVIAASLWRDLLIQHSIESHTGPKGTSAASIVAEWNAAFIPMVRTCLVPTGLFATPLGDFPHPPARSVPGGRRCVKTRADGTEIKHKLITDVPLKLTDYEATKILFFNIERDRNLILQWAEYQADSIEAKLEGRDRFAHVGTPRTVQTAYVPGDKRKFLTSHENPKVFFNAVATFKLHGFSPSTDSPNTLLYPSPISDTAVMLALPTAGSEIPLLAILISEHPCITPSVLESFELFDSSGMRVGLVETDAGTYLHGWKDRKGPANSELHVLLSPKALRAINLLVRMTDPVRKYLREKGDSNWRYLLINTGRGFGNPRRSKRLATYTSTSDFVDKRASEIADVCSISKIEANSLARRFSLSALRATCGVLVYLETNSLAAMAKALGHKEYRSDLLSHYLPDSILNFFQERWIRQFQTGLIAAALENSPFLQEALGMPAGELDDFLRKHPLKKLPEPAEAPPEKKGEALFGLDVGIVSVLLGLDQAVEHARSMGGQPGPKATNFSNIAKLLCSYIESEECGREDLQAMLAEARVAASAEEFEEVVYA